MMCIANHHMSSYNYYSQEIWELQCSHDGKVLAKGGNYNTLNIWDTSATSSATADISHEITAP